MKRLLFALVAGMIWTSGCAFGQSVQLYGIVDTGIEYVTHANNLGDSLVRMPAITGSTPSRWGLRGSEPIGEGYSVRFNLENSFNLRAGDLNQGGRLFGRQAWVGISGPTGSWFFGRQNTATLYTILDNDVMGPAIYGIGSVDAYIPNARSDNAIGYLGTYRYVTIGATYSFGRDVVGGNSPGQGLCAGSVPGAPTQCRQWTAMIKYDGPTFGGGISYDEQRGGTGAAANFFDGRPPVPMTSATDIDSRLLIAAHVTVGKAKVEGGWLHRNAENESSEPDIGSDIFFGGVSYQVTPSIIAEAEVIRVINKRHDTRATLSTVRGFYLVSERTALYAQVGYLWNSSQAAYTISAGGGGTTPRRGANQLGTMIGIRQLF
ncbi:porin [Caballeronia turbans]|jgi:predicted porin|uniref:porin n=1 Tax=Caballeronia sp. INML2 TaxID=2921748 RepID=UPI00074C2D66|nr:porin [Caballeronia sp. INML2]SAL53512.1 porin [Caballeronia turbans]